MKRPTVISTEAPAPVFPQEDAGAKWRNLLKTEPVTLALRSPVVQGEVGSYVEGFLDSLVSAEAFAEAGPMALVWAEPAVARRSK